MAAEKIVIQQDKEKPIERSVLAKAIVDLSRAVQRLNTSGLNREAVTVLLAHSTRLSLGATRDILRSIEQLERDYVR